MIVCLGALVWSLSPSGASAGLKVTHDGQPIYNLQVSVTDLSQQPQGVFLFGTTDGTGSYTFTPSNGRAIGTSGFLYTFQFGGTGYAFKGPVDKVLSVSV